MAAATILVVTKTALGGAASLGTRTLGETFQAIGPIPQVEPE